ncbi:MAG TPA: hypothetical protein VME43_20280 [Bryobacteraceae bacterium]|nr:hypothetical protein [Bryobacteraceae bacterium]
MPTRKFKSRSGVAIVEFSMSLLFLTPLLLGAFVFGFRLVCSIQMMQITRDLGHMYIEGINFRNTGPISNAQTLASGFNLTSSGSSVVILSEVKVEQQSDCDAANIAPAGKPCANLGQPVFVEQLTIGNTSSGSSAFGTPPTTTVNGVTNEVTSVNQASSSSAVASGFNSVLALNAGEIAYVAEMVNQTPALNIPGFSGEPLVYARTIF